MKVIKKDMDRNNFHPFVLEIEIETIDDLNDLRIMMSLANSGQTDDEDVKSLIDAITWEVS